MPTSDRGEGVAIVACPPGRVGDWAALRAELWPDANPAAHHAELAALLAEGRAPAAFIAFDDAGRAIGFAEARVRTDPVNGCATSPVAFLEGVYVAPETRRRGIARALVAAVEAWARTTGCTEFASDALAANEVGHAVHRALGFTETERVVCFRKELAAGMGAAG